MVKHIVIWKLKDFAENADKTRNAKLMKDSLLDLKHSIKEIKNIEIWINSEKANKDNFDIILISEFESYEDLEKYKIHPEHNKVSDFISKIRVKRAAVDFEFYKE